MFLPKNFPLAIEGNEKFFIHSVVVSPEFANEDITAKMVIVNSKYLKLIVWNVMNVI